MTDEEFIEEFRIFLSNRDANRNKPLETEIKRLKLDLSIMRNMLDKEIRRVEELESND